MPKKENNEKKTPNKVEVVIKQEPNCAVVLDVKALPIIVKNAKKKAIKELGKEVEIPGFRKGKAPEEIIEKRYKSSLEEELHRQIAREAFSAVQEVAKIPALGSHSQIKFDLKSHSLEEGATLTFSYETSPNVPSIDPKKFILKPIPIPPIQEKEIEEFLYQLRFFYAEWKNITDRPIQEKDYVLLDMSSLETTPPTLVFSKTRFEVSDSRMAKWMKKLLIGKKLGEEVEGISEPDKDLKEEEKKAFEKRKVLIKILEIQEAILPSVDEAFAKQLGFQKVEEINPWIETHLKELSKKHEKEEEKKQVKEFLVSFDYDLPSSLIAAESKDRKERFLQAKENLGNWEKLSEDEKKKLEKSFLEKSIEILKLFFSSYSFFNEHKLTFSQDELFQIVFSMHPEYEQKPSKVLEKDIHMAMAELYILKSEDYILKIAKGEKA